MEDNQSAFLPSVPDPARGPFQRPSRHRTFTKSPEVRFSAHSLLRDPHSHHPQDHHSRDASVIKEPLLSFRRFHSYCRYSRLRTSNCLRQAIFLSKPQNTKASPFSPPLNIKPICLMDHNFTPSTQKNKCIRYQPDFPLTYMEIFL